MTRQLAEFAVDGRDGGSATVVAPTSLEEAAEILTAAAAESRPVAPLGSGSGPAPVTEVVLTTRGLAGIIDYQPDDLTVVVGAGTTLADLDELLADRALSAILPETAPTRTIGGVVASGSSGYRRLGYGPTRDRVLEVTMATGYGEVVRAGGRLVKNVTGYDLSRLSTGSYGSLGVIGSVCLKLWPVARPKATIRVENAAAALSTAFRPVAVLETMDGALVYVQGDSATIAEQASRLGGETADGFVWPEPLHTPVSCTLAVPARHVTVGVERLASVDHAGFVAQHGVGIVDVGFASLDIAAVQDLRSWAESVGGSLRVDADGLDTAMRWGTPPGSIEIQRRLKNLFDPSGICNPGVLPGGL